MNNNLTTNNLTAIGGEPRIRDLGLAERLGMVDRHKIRNLIAANRSELEMHGEVSAWRAETSQAGGRPGKSYYLNEGQALVICALSRTPVAATIRKALIEVFMAYRCGKIVPVREHHRQPPVRLVEPVDRQSRMTSFIRSFRDRPEALAEWAIAMVDAQESALAAFTGDRAYLRI